MADEMPELSAQERAGKAFPVSWDQFHRDCRALTWRLNDVGPFHAVVAITRGGLVPAAIVARELGVRIIDTVCVASYDHTKQGDLKVLKGISADTAKLGDTSGRFGLLPDEGGAWFFPRMMGLDHALKMSLLHEVYPAAEALRLGLVTEVVAEIGRAHV